MRIQHNIPALNSYRNYSNNVKQVSKNLEKLSTGYKINRAGDDAAGLAISEKMRIQITGLEKAQDNAKAGINLVQTAEGALTEVHDMLNRMYSLAEQSANGTYDNSVDRKQLQKEVDSLRTEIDRIADSTNYNGIKLLDGTMEKQTTAMAMVDQYGLAKGGLTIKNDGDPGKVPQAGVFSIDLKDTILTNDGKTAAAADFNFFGVTVALDKVAGNASIGGEALANQVAAKWNSDTANMSASVFQGATVRASVEGAKVVFTMDQAPTTDISKAAAKYDNVFTGLTSNKGEEVAITVEQEPVSTSTPRKYAEAQLALTDLNIGDGTTLQIGKETYVFAVGRNSGYTGIGNVVDLTDMESKDVATNISRVAMRLSDVAQGNEMFKVGVDLNTDTVTFTEREGAVDYTQYNLQGTATKDKDGIWAGLIKVGTADLTKSGTGLTLQIGDTADEFNQMNVSVKDMHSTAMGIGRVDISEQSMAQSAMDAIKAATNYVSDVRGGLGALQNRLDHTINNLSVAQENITDAESTIRDTDVAKEMMAYTKNNILVQSAQAMLAQANQLPQGVLQLLG